MAQTKTTRTDNVAEASVLVRSADYVPFRRFMPERVVAPVEDIRRRVMAEGDSDDCDTIQPETVDVLCTCGHPRTHHDGKYEGHRGQCVRMNRTCTGYDEDETPSGQVTQPDSIVQTSPQPDAVAVLIEAVSSTVKYLSTINRDEGDDTFLGAHSNMADDLESAIAAARAAISKYREAKELFEAAPILLQEKSR